MGYIKKKWTVVFHVFLRQSWCTTVSLAVLRQAGQLGCGQGTSPRHRCPPAGFGDSLEWCSMIYIAGASSVQHLARHWLHRYTGYTGCTVCTGCIRHDWRRLGIPSETRLMLLLNEFRHALVQRFKESSLPAYIGFLWLSYDLFYATFFLFK